MENKLYIANTARAKAREIAMAQNTNPNPIAKATLNSALPIVRKLIANNTCPAGRVTKKFMVIGCFRSSITPRKLINHRAIHGTIKIT